MHYSPQPLHIPDGFLSFVVSMICWVITAITISVAVSRTNKSLGERQVPLMGVMAAFIFAAQMINFPVAGGTSGHLLGGALAAITLGPWAGMLVMTAVIAVQGLLFQDGGLLVMGANILNMGLLTAAIGYGLYRGVSAAKPYPQAGGCRCGGLAFGDGGRVGHLAAIMVERHLAIADRHPGHAGGPCLDRAGRGAHHGRRADLYPADASRPAWLNSESPEGAAAGWLPVC